MHRCTDAIPNSSPRSNRYSPTFADTDALCHTAFRSNHPRTDVIAFAHADPSTNSHPHGHAKPNSQSYGYAKPYPHTHTHTPTHTNTPTYCDSYHRTLADPNAGAHRPASNRLHLGRS